MRSPATADTGAPTIIVLLFLFAEAALAYDSHVCESDGVCAGIAKNDNLNAVWALVFVEHGPAFVYVSKIDATHHRLPEVPPTATAVKLLEVSEAPGITECGHIEAPNLLEIYFRGLRKFRDLASEWLRAPLLATLYIEHTDIRTIQSHLFRHTPRIARIYLPSNDIGTVDESAFFGVTPEILNVSYNHGLSCDHLFSRLTLPTTELIVTCDGTANHSGVAVRRLIILAASSRKSGTAAAHYGYHSVLKEHGCAAGYSHNCYDDGTVRCDDPRAVAPICNDTACIFNNGLLNCSHGHATALPYVNSSVRILDISKNNIESASVVPPTLSALFLDSNRLSVLTVKLPAALREFSVADNFITYIKHDVFQLCKSLIYLNLRGNHIGSSATEQLLPSSLLVLDVSGNRFESLHITDVVDFRGTDLPFLSHLVIAGNRTANVSVARSRRLREIVFQEAGLETLDISYTAVTSIGRHPQVVRRLIANNYYYQTLLDINVTDSFVGTAMPSAVYRGRNTTRSITVITAEKEDFVQQHECPACTSIVVRNSSIRTLTLIASTTKSPLLQSIDASFNKIDVWPNNLPAEFNLEHNRIAAAGRFPENAESVRIAFNREPPLRISPAAAPKVFFGNTLDGFSDRSRLEILSLVHSSIKVFNFCNGYHSLISLNLSTNLLSSAHFDCVLAKLEILDLSHNYIESFTATSSVLPALRFLWLGHNRIASFSFNTVVDIVDVSYNRLRSLAPVAAKVLFASHNSLTSYILSAATESADLSHNQLQTLNESAIAGFSAGTLFNELDASHNLLRDIDLVRNVRILRLAGCRFTSIRSLQKIVVGYLDVADNDIASISGSSFEFLQSLVVDGNRDIRLHDWSAPRLVYFSGSRCDFHTFPVLPPSVKTIVLRGNRRLPGGHLRMYPMARNIDLSDCAFGELHIDDHSILTARNSGIHRFTCRAGCHNIDLSYNSLEGGISAHPFRITAIHTNISILESTAEVLDFRHSNKLRSVVAPLARYIDVSHSPLLATIDAENAESIVAGPALRNLRSRNAADGAAVRLIDNIFVDSFAHCDQCVHGDHWINCSRLNGCSSSSGSSSDSVIAHTPALSTENIIIIVLLPFVVFVVFITHIRSKLQ